MSNVFTKKQKFLKKIYMENFFFGNPIKRIKKILRILENKSDGAKEKAENCKEADFAFSPRIYNGTKYKKNTRPAKLCGAR